MCGHAGLCQTGGLGMPHNPVLSPTHPDNDALILEGVLAGVYDQGARYGLSKPRRDLLALTLQTLLRSMREDWEGLLADVLTQMCGQPHRAPETTATAIHLQRTLTGRPSQPEDGPRRGDSHLPDTTPRLTG